jgi:hypothetical protein
MSDTNEEVVVTPEANESAEEQPQVETIAVPKSDYDKLNQTVGSLKRELKDLKKPKDTPAAEVTESRSNNTGELDETQLDYLDLKGISDSDDIKVIEDVIKKTGMTVREALKDEYVTARLGANKANRDVKAATPSATKRTGGNQGTDLATAVARYEESGFKDLPDDYALRSAVVNAVAAKTNTNKPSWH